MWSLWSNVGRNRPRIGLCSKALQAAPDISASSCLFLKFLGPPPWSAGLRTGRTGFFLPLAHKSSATARRMHILVFRRRHHRHQYSVAFAGARPHGHRGGSAKAMQRWKPVLPMRRKFPVSYCEPWANRAAPWKALKWIFDPEAPLLLRPRMDGAQWRWCLEFLGQCNDAAFERNVAQIVALGAYSHQAHQALARSLGCSFTGWSAASRTSFATKPRRRGRPCRGADAPPRGCSGGWCRARSCCRLSPRFAATPRTSAAAPTRPPTRAAMRACSPSSLPATVPSRARRLLFGHEVLSLPGIGGAIKSVAVRACQQRAGGPKDPQNSPFNTCAPMPSSWPAAATARRCCAA